MVTVKRSNPKAFEQLEIRIKELSGYNGKVGWLESSKYPDGTPVAMAAASNEFGNPKMSVPARPFIRPTIIEQKDKWLQMAKSGAKAILGGKENGESVMTKIVIQAQSDIRKKIASITSPPLSPITLAARKYRQEGKQVTGKTIGEIAKKLKDGTLDTSGVSTKPLVDTQVMFEQMVAVVEKV